MLQMVSAEKITFHSGHICKAWCILSQSAKQAKDICSCVWLISTALSSCDSSDSFIWESYFSQWSHFQGLFLTDGARLSAKWRLVTAPSAAAAQLCRWQFTFTFRFRFTFTFTFTFVHLYLPSAAAKLCGWQYTFTHTLLQATKNSKFNITCVSNLANLRAYWSIVWLIWKAWLSSVEQDNSSGKGYSVKSKYSKSKFKSTCFSLRAYWSIVLLIWKARFRHLQRRGSVSARENMSGHGIGKKYTAGTYFVFNISNLLLILGREALILGGVSW